MNFNLKSYLEKVDYLFIRIFGFVIFLLILNIHFLTAQSTHYWSQNFNTESSLLAGAVVGGNAGPSAVYYNPALINQDESHKFALSANLLSFQSMKVENIAGVGTAYDKFILQLQPKFISYAFTPKKKSNITYEFAFMVPLTRNIKLTYLFQDDLDIIQRLDGTEDYIGEVYYKNEYNDYYIGGGFSNRLSERFALGASLFVSYKKLEYRSTIAMKAMQNADTVYSQGVPEAFYFAQNTFAEQFKFWDISLVLRIGAHYQSPNKNWGLGLNISFPNLSIYGEGDVTKEFSRSNIFDNSTNQFVGDIAFVSTEDNVRTKIKDPFSVAFGLQYKMPNRKNSIMLTVHYYNAIDEYALLETTGSNVVGNVYFLDVAETMNFYTSAKSIFNLGLGFIQYVNENLTINGGFKTDFNNLEGQRQKVMGTLGNKPVLSDLYFDKYHIIAGPRLDVKKFGFVIGIQYTWGRENDLYNVVNFSDPVEYNPETNQSLQGVREDNMKVNYNEISLFFGATYGFGK